MSVRGSQRPPYESICYAPSSTLVMFVASTIDPSRRRCLAWLGALLWVLGFEVAPNLHLGLHDRLTPHTHGEVVGRDDERHDHHDVEAAHAHHDDKHHDDEHHDDEHELAVFPEFAAQQGQFKGSTTHGPPDPSLGAAASRPDPAHGDHDLLHRGLAVVTPQAVTPTVGQTPFVVVLCPQPLADRRLSRVPTRPRARGPPQPTWCRDVDSAI